MHWTLKWIPWFLLASVKCTGSWNVFACIPLAGNNLTAVSSLQFQSTFPYTAVASNSGVIVLTYQFWFQGQLVGLQQWKDRQAPSGVVPPAHRWFCLAGADRSLHIAARWNNIVDANLSWLGSWYGPRPHTIYSRVHLNATGLLGGRGAEGSQ